VTRFRFKK